MATNTTEAPFSNRKNSIWVTLSGAMALTFVSMLFLPNSGAGEGMVATYSSMLWCGIFGASLARYLSHSGWIGFAIGSGVGFTLQLVSQLI